MWDDEYEIQEIKIRKQLRFVRLLEKEGITEEMIQRAMDIPEIREKIVECWKIQDGAHLQMQLHNARVNRSKKK